jgi:RAQPRD family integrative conjugative element protein
MRLAHLPTLASRRTVTHAWRNLRAAGALVLFAVLVAAAPATRADDDDERESLARISYELARVQQMVAEASKRAPQGQRVRFRYDWLSRDLDLLRQGVEDHADAARQPRPVTPLRGDYRR